ncbi:hypothetical protein DXV76_20950 [Rhodobacteraceae bacterium CCMM004]|nr:hypothetical protein DXV76_20950 [Rhodobacteraceae bacterium CCMM004]
MPGSRPAGSSRFHSCMIAGVTFSPNHPFSTTSCLILLTAKPISFAAASSTLRTAERSCTSRSTSSFAAMVHAPAATPTVEAILAHPPPCVTRKDAPLVRFSPMPGDTWSLGDAFEGTMVFGRSGSGKTSGSGAAMARAFLRSGMGGIVLCAKNDEADNWRRYAAETGRSGSVIRVDGSGRYRFNFLEYEMQRDHLGADVLASNVVSTLQSVIEVATRAAGLEAGAQGDVFWQKSTRLLLMRAVDFLYATTGRVRLGEIIDFIESAPTSRAMMQDEQWRETSFFAQTFREFYATGGGAHPPAPQDVKRLDQFWRVSFPAMAEKTRSNILTTLQTDLEDLLRPKMRTIFSTDSNVVPELSHEGAVILLDFPLFDWNETGVLAQMIFKYLWMRATQRRKATDATRPVFLWADECQLFLSGYDMEFQSTARSSRTATVLMTQNLPSFYSRIGGKHPEHTVNAMMGNLRTKIFHNNDCPTTNKWAAELIGKTSVWRASFGQNSGWSSNYSDSFSQGQSSGENFGDNRGKHDSASFGHNATTFSGGRSEGESYGHNYGRNYNMSQTQGGGMSGGRNYGMQEQRDYAVEPHEFATDLATGGAANGGQVTGVVVLPGRTFERNGKHWMTIGFRQ